MCHMNHKLFSFILLWKGDIDLYISVVESSVCRNQFIARHTPIEYLNILQLIYPEPVYDTCTLWNQEALLPVTAVRVEGDLPRRYTLCCRDAACCVSTAANDAKNLPRDKTCGRL